MVHQLACLAVKMTANTGNIMQQVEIISSQELLEIDWATIAMGCRQIHLDIQLIWRCPGDLADDLNCTISDLAD